MNNNSNKMPISSPIYQSPEYCSPTPLGPYQQTPQISYFQNTGTPNIHDNSSPSINKMASQNYLSMYTSNNNILSPNNYVNGQTPTMNIPLNNEGYNKGNSPRTPNNNINALAGSSPAQPNNISIYQSQSNNNYGFGNKNNIPKVNPMNDFLNDQDIQPKLQNIVSTANLGCPLNLRQIALQARNAEYNPKRFAAVIMRIKEPKTTALIFSSGKMVCTGAKSEEDSKKASRKYAKIIRSLGFNVEFKEFMVQNIVGSCDVKFQISLSKLNMKLGKNNTISDKGNNKKKNICHYEPEIFPGLIYHMLEPEIVLLIFVSGKIVLTGAKERGQIYKAFENIYPVLLKYKHDNNGKTNKMLHKEEVQEMKEFKNKQDKNETQ